MIAFRETERQTSGIVHLIIKGFIRNEMSERAYRHRNEFGRWMERDLLHQLRRSGYVTGRISSRDGFRPAPAFISPMKFLRCRLSALMESLTGTVRCKA